MRIAGDTIFITRGDSGNFDVFARTAAAPQQIIPLVTGDTVYFTVKTSWRTSVNVLQKVVTSFTPEGKAEIQLLPSDTKELEVADYAYDVQITWANGQVETIIEPAIFTIGPEVTAWPV